MTQRQREEWRRATPTAIYCRERQKRKKGKPGNERRMITRLIGLTQNVHVWHSSLTLSSSRPHAIGSNCWELTIRRFASAHAVSVACRHNVNEMKMKSQPCCERDICRPMYHMLWYMLWCCVVCACMYDVCHISDVDDKIKYRSKSHWVYF